MLIAYNKKGQRPLQFTKLYSNKGAKAQNAISKEEAEAILDTIDEVVESQIDLFSLSENANSISE